MLPFLLFVIRFADDATVTANVKENY